MTEERPSPIVEAQQTVGAPSGEMPTEDGVRSETRLSSHNGWKISKIAAIVGAAISACAAMAAILGYKSPPTVPVVQGATIVVCPDRFFEPSLPGEGAAFLAEVDRQDLGIVFISDLAVLNYGCWAKRDSASKVSADYPFVYVSDTIKWTSQGRPRGGTLTIGVRNVFLGNPALLEIVAPESDDYLVRTECGAKCFGATGLYKVSSFADGIHHYRLTPVPANSGMVETYSCTLKKIAASTWYERFLACRW